MVGLIWERRYKIVELILEMFVSVKFFKKLTSEEPLQKYEETSYEMYVLRGQHLNKTK